MRGEKKAGGARLGRRRWSSAARGSASGQAGGATREKIWTMTRNGSAVGSACARAKKQMEQSESWEQHPSEQNSSHEIGPPSKARPTNRSATPCVRTGRRPKPDCAKTFECRLMRRDLATSRTQRKPCFG